MYTQILILSVTHSSFLSIIKLLKNATQRSLGHHQSQSQSRGWKAEQRLALCMSLAWLGLAWLGGALLVAWARASRNGDLVGICLLFCVALELCALGAPPRLSPSPSASCGQPCLALCCAAGGAGDAVGPFRVCLAMPLIKSLTFFTAFLTNLAVNLQLRAAARPQKSSFPARRSAYATAFWRCQNSGNTPPKQQAKTNCTASLATQTDGQTDKPTDWQTERIDSKSASAFFKHFMEIILNA